MGRVRPGTLEKIKRAVALREQGLKQDEIAERMGVTRGPVVKWLTTARELGLFAGRAGKVSAKKKAPPKASAKPAAKPAATGGFRDMGFRRPSGQDAARVTHFEGKAAARRAQFAQEAAGDTAPACAAPAYAHEQEVRLVLACGRTIDGTVLLFDGVDAPLFTALIPTDMIAEVKP